MRRLLAVFLTVLLILPVSASQAPKGYIALTFDDGPSGRITQRLLEGLEQRQVSATFFLCCYRMEQYPDTLRAIGEGGHEVGLHSCCHQYMNTMTAREVAEDLEECQEILAETSGLSTRLFRPPGGRCSETLLEEARNAGLSVILWSLDPEDWDPGKRSRIKTTLTNRVQDGDVILLHDLYPQTVTAVLDFIDEMQAQGYMFCTVSQLAELRGVRLQAGEVYRSFPE